MWFKMLSSAIKYLFYFLSIYVSSEFKTTIYGSLLYSASLVAAWFTMNIFIQINYLNTRIQQWWKSL